MRCAIYTMLILLAISPVRASERQPLNDLVDVATSYLLDRAARLGQDDRITVNPPDKRLRLAACRQPLTAFLPAGAREFGNLTVGVRCGAPQPWRVFLTARVSRFARILTTTRAIRRGAMIVASDLRVTHQEVRTGNMEYLTDPLLAVGKVTTRSLSAGAALTNTNLRAARVVRRGERVMIVAQAVGFKVRMDGEALADGAVGDSIRVRNLRSKQQVQGVVQARGVVRVPL